MLDAILAAARAALPAWVSRSTFDTFAASAAREGLIARIAARLASQAIPTTRQIEAVTDEEIRRRYPPTVREENWGTGRGQGRRRGSQVLGAMSDPPRGVRRYTDPLGSVVDLPRSDRHALSSDVIEADRRVLAYLKARTAGLGHELAMRYVELRQDGRASEEIDDALRGALAEMREHPWASRETAERIASDHLRANPQAYAGPKIAEILDVRDTRQWEEGPDDRWHPIPGSGSLNECARCGKGHEVWARVRLSDGTERIMGTGCARQTNPEAAARFEAADRAAKRLRQLEAKLAKLRRDAATWTRAEAEVEQLDVPAFVEVKEDGYTLLRAGDEQVWLRPWHNRADREDALRSIWRRAETRRRIPDCHKCEYAQIHIPGIEREVEQVSRRLSELRGSGMISPG